MDVYTGYPLAGCASVELHAKPERFHTAKSRVMDLLSWFRKHKSAPAMTTMEPSEPLTFAEGERKLGGLDMEAALKAHAVWKQRLQEVFDGTLAMPEIEKVRRDDLCLMGQWLHGDGKLKFGDLQAHQRLLNTHATFHDCVSKALTAHASGDRSNAAELQKEVQRQSLRVQVELVRLFVAARDMDETA